MSPLHEITSKREGNSFPEYFEFDDELIDTLIAKEKGALVHKLSTIHAVLQEKGLHNITGVMDDFSAEVSSKEELLNAIYGDYLLREEN